MPFSVDNQGRFDNITTNPDMFLEQVKLTKTK